MISPVAKNTFAKVTSRLILKPAYWLTPKVNSLREKCLCLAWLRNVI